MSSRSERGFKSSLALGRRGRRFSIAYFASHPLYYPPVADITVFHSLLARRAQPRRHQPCPKSTSSRSR